MRTFVALAFLILTPAVHAAETLYATSLRAHVGGNAVIAGNLYVIDPESGASTLIGAIRVDGAPVGVIAIAEHPRTHKLYGLTAGLSKDIPSSLVTIDLDKAAATIVAPLSTRGTDIGFDDDGTLYMWAPEMDRITKVDLASGIATPVGTTELKDTAGGGIAVDPKAKRALVAVTGAAGTLDSIDLFTGTPTRGPALSGAPYTTAIDNLTFAPWGELFAVNSNGGAPSHASLIVINPANGKVRNVGPLPDDVRGLIFAAPRKTQVSELPLRAIALVVLAVAGLGVIAYAFLHKHGVK